MKAITPLPWKMGDVLKANGGLKRFYLRGGPDNSLIASCDAITETEKHEANAAYIVTAANAYPRMVEALEAALANLRTGDWNQEPIEATIQILQAALSAARAGQ